MKNEVTKMSAEFYEGGAIPKGLNSPFICLIPKVVGSKNIAD